MKKLELTDTQFKTLIQLVYLGNFMANATREPDDLIDAYEQLEQYLYAKAGDFDCADLVDTAPSLDGVYPTRDFEEMMDKFIAQYDDDVFWEELLHRLAERDLVKQFGESAVGRMSLVERIEKERPILKEYDDEFVAHGIDNLVLKGK